MDKLNANAKSFKPKNFKPKYNRSRCIGIKYNVKKNMDEFMHISEICALFILGNE